jgi:ferredoxin
MKIKIDQELCVSVASCVAIAGKTFELDENGLATVKEGEHDDDATIMAAAESCPTKAIYLYDDQGNQIYPPIS